MKIQKSAVPYIILLLSLLVGIPVADEVLDNSQNSNVVTIEIEYKVFLTDKTTEL
ncbi:MAG: hypothetical protein ACI94Y_002403 [Maribacter sp.]|jgi:hypothetical protein